MSSWSEKSLGKVQIGDLIARGGMAEVYLGEHTSLNRKVAVKIMREHVDEDPETRARFEREAQVIASLRHPNIIQIFDYELVNGRPFLIMELVPGPSLGSYLKAIHKNGEKLPLDVVARILSALASAIDYAHNQNIVHRDIKPSNVLLRSIHGSVTLDNPLPEDVEPILTDFGLVRLLDSSIQTSTGTVSGTPAYMSPEQARGEKVDRKTDIYSLGVMLYEMLAGTVPFDAESSFGVLMKHLNDPPPPIHGVSTDLQSVIDRALAKDPSLRYGTAKELADEFIAVFNGQTVSMDTAMLAKMAQSSTMPDNSAQARSFSWAWAVIAAFAVIGLVFLALRPALLNLPDEDQPVGRISYSDFNAQMDKATLTFSNNLPVPPKGTHYEAWYLAQGGEVRRSIGSIKLDNASQGQLVFINPGQENILSQFDQIEVTIEADNDPNPKESSGNIIASSIFPPLALAHIRHVVVSFQNAPEGIALIQGLWETADRIDTSILELQGAFESGEEELFRLKNEEIINQLVGSANKDQYIDWNKNGSIDDPGDGFGLLENGEEGGLGYIPAAISHTEFAAKSADATESIQAHGVHVVTSIENMRGWSEQLLEKAVQLQAMSFGREMQPILLDMQLLSKQVLFGVDTNGNELIEPISGEGGGDTAYEHAYYMAEMPLLSGQQRIPPPAVSEQK